MNPKNKKTKLRIVIVIGILLIVIIGIAIAIAKTDHPGKYKEVSLVVGATDWLSFWGAIGAALLGAGIAIIGVWWTLQENQRQYRQDQINQTIPYFVLRYYHHKSNYDPFSHIGDDSSSSEKHRSLFEPQTEEEIEYTEFIRDSACVILTKGRKEWKSDFSKDQWKLIKHEGFYEERNGDNSYSLCQRNMIYLPIEMENVGRGSTVFVKVGLNRKDEDHVYINMPARKVGESFLIRVLLTNCTEADLGEYDLDVVYTDISQIAYRQRFSYSIVKTKDNHYGSSMSFASKQEAFDSWDILMNTK